MRLHVDSASRCLSCTAWLVSGKLLYKPKCRFQSDKWDSVRMGSDDVVFLIFLYQVRHTFNTLTAQRVMRTWLTPHLALDLPH